MSPPEPPVAPAAAPAEADGAGRASAGAIRTVARRTATVLKGATARGAVARTVASRRATAGVGSATQGRPARRGELSAEPSAIEESAGEIGRSRFGWLFATIWLFYLSEPLRGLLQHDGGWERDLGYVALGAFVVVYLLMVAQLRRDRRPNAVRSPLSHRWAGLLALSFLAVLLVPGAGQHALSALVYVVAVAAMSLPTRQVAAVVVVMFGVATALTHTVDGWRDSGYGLAVVLAGVAASGVRLAAERNRRLVDAQGEIAELAVENERARIAGDLHDILGHSLTVVTVKAELAQRLLDVDLERARAELRDLERLCRDALSDVRTTAMGVRGISLPGEIAAAREALAAADIHANLPTAADEVPSRCRELFAWTIREAVTNLVRHSGASQCEIRLTRDSVEILDNGIGVAGGRAGAALAGSAAGDPAVAAEEAEGRVGGQGLPGLRRRVEALGGQLSIGDRAGTPGFRVFVRVPA